MLDLFTLHLVLADIWKATSSSDPPIEGTRCVLSAPVSRMTRQKAQWIFDRVSEPLRGGESMAKKRKAAKKAAKKK